MKHLKNAQKIELERIKNKILNLYIDLGYARARLKSTEDKISYLEKLRDNMEKGK